MQTITQNIINIFGEKGKNWLENLPQLVDTLKNHWSLRHLIPVNNMTYNYVAKAIDKNNIPVILKISCDEKSFEEEKVALNYFSGTCVKLIDYHEQYYALLLQQAVPGETLKIFYPQQEEFVMDCYVNVMKQLHHHSLPKQHSYRHIRDWLMAIDRVSSDNIPHHLLQKATQFKNKLLASLSKEIFLHGDLHHDNILKHQDSWLAIDPKGVVGEAEFEIAAFDFMYIDELANANNVKNIFEKRVDLLAHKANLNAQRIKDWVFVRLILMAAWSIEDGGEPSWAIQLAHLFAD
ncbi:MAG: hydroxyurea phosphotransferase [uncultured bacterium]|nr:MAG: hydroxyurea phosphotransferase [uncultured bacterium]